MGEGGYKIRNPEGIYFLSFATVGWVDVFTRSCYSDVVVNSLNYCIAKKGLNVYAWIIMSNHVHLIVSAKPGILLSDILRDFKKFTSVEIINAIRENIQESRKEWLLLYFKEAGKNNSRNSSFQFWQQNNQPIELTSNEMIDQRLNYLHQNPVEARLIDKAESWMYSSAIDYCGTKGLVNIELLC